MGNIKHGLFSSSLFQTYIHEIKYKKKETKIK